MAYDFAFLLINGAATVISILLIIYALRSHFKTTVTWILIGLTATGAAWFAIDSILYFVGDGLTLPLYTIEYSVRVFTSVFFLNLALAFYKGGKILKKKYLYFPLYMPAVIMVILIHLLMTGTQLLNFGYVPTFASPGGILYLIYISVYLLAGFFFYISTYIISKSPTEKRRILPIIIGSVFPLVFNATAGTWFFMFSKTIPDMNNVFITLAVCFFTYAVVKYKTFITPVIERGKVTTTSYRLRPGDSYLIKEKRPLLGYKVFVDAVRRSQLYGLCITTRHPKEIRNRYGLRVTPVIWLSKQKVEHSINPANMGELAYTMSEFVNKTEKSVVLLDGVEYLITTNGFEQTLNFLHDVRESVALSNSRLVVPINPKAVNEKELALIERYMKGIPIRERTDKG
jgi:hypothetical protein